MIYEKKLSDCIKALMYQVMKKSTSVVNGFIIFRNRTIIKAYLDEEECSVLLKSMIINKENVLKYLVRKYIPTWNETGCIFKDQSCIQKVIIREDKTLYIHIKNSEPHKIVTDTLHIMRLLTEHGFDFLPEVKFYIEQVKISFQDVMLYNICLKEFGYNVPSASRIYERQLRFKYQNLETIAAIKKRSVKRKFLRWLVKEEKINWSELRFVLKIEDYSRHNIKRVCATIRNDARERGVKVDY